MSATMWYDQSFAAVGLSLGISVIYLLGLAIYRLYWHPLRSIPGPKHFAVSGLPQAIQNHIRGIFDRKVLRMHEEYGDIVRTGPNHVSMSGFTGWPEVFGYSRSGRPEFSHWNPNYHGGDSSVHSIFTADKENHRRQRRLMAHAFSHAAISEQEPLIKKYVDKLFAHLRREAEQGVPTEVVKWYNFTTFDIIGDLVFGEPFNCLDNTDYHPWVSNVFASVKVGRQILPLLKMPWLGWTLPLLISKKEIEKRDKHKAMSIHKAERRVALGPAPGGRRDIMTYILRYNDEKGMRHSEILGNSDSLIIAGSETTATALSGLTYYITTNPQAFERVTREVREAFRTEQEITINSTMHLKYMNACIEEGLRVYPPVTETPPRISPGEVVNGHWIPKGTFISIHQWADYHNARNFVEPDAFIPERWLSADHELYDPKFSADRKSVFEPFSYGPRNCLGKNLAYAELRLITARLFWNFDFVLQPECRDWPATQKTFAIWEKTPLWVQLKKVERS